MINIVNSKLAYWNIPTVVFRIFLNLLQISDGNLSYVRKRAQLLMDFDRYTVTLTVTGSNNANIRIETQPRKRQDPNLLHGAESFLRT